MLHLLVLLNLVFILGWLVGNSALSDAEDFGSNLVSSLRNDANLDLSIDEEYEDLRVELLAYHTALASLSESQTPNEALTRRSMMSTPCWQVGGICIKYDLCIGYRFMTEVPGCKNRLNVCCFAWNKFRLKDFRDKGIGVLAMPWSLKYKFGGKGIVDVDSSKLTTPGYPKYLVPKPKKYNELQPASESIENPDHADVILVPPPRNETDNNDLSGDTVHTVPEETGDVQPNEEPYVPGEIKGVVVMGN